MEVSVIESWLKLYRSISRHWVSTDPEALAFFILLLAKAAYEPTKQFFRGKLIYLNSGQLLFQRPQWEARYNISGSKMYRLLEKFKADNMITVQPAGRLYSLVTITNWAGYQSTGVVYPSNKIGQENEQHEMQYLSDYETTQQQGNEQESDKSRTTIYKEIKKLRNKSIDYTPIIQNHRSHFSSEAITFFDKYIDILKTTRRSNKLADSVMCQILEETIKYPDVVVMSACNTVIKNPALHSKKENYFYGILRNTTVEEAQYRLGKGAAKDGKVTKPNGSGYDTSKIIYNGPVKDYGDIDY